MSLERVKDRIAPATAPAAPTLKDQIEGLGAEIARALPGSIDAERFARNTLTVLRQTPKLAQCTWPSIAGALMTAAQVGLEPGPLGHCWLIPRWNPHYEWPDGRKGANEATFQLGYTGLVELARRSGVVGAIRTGIIYDWDELDESDGTDPHLIIRPIRPRDPDATPLAYWCVVERLDGASDHWSVMEIAEIEAARRKIPGSDRRGSAWVEHFDAMARITVFRRMRGMLPVSIEMATALEADGQVVTRNTPVLAAAPTQAPANVALDGPGLSARAEAIEGDIPDGEPWDMGPEDLPQDGVDAAPQPAEHPDEGLDGRAADEPVDGSAEGAPGSTSPGDLSASADPDIDEPPPFPATRTWASKHGLGDVVKGTKNGTTACRRLAEHLDVDQTVVWTLITNDTPPSETTT